MGRDDEGFRLVAEAKGRNPLLPAWCYTHLLDLCDETRALAAGAEDCFELDLESYGERAKREMVTSVRWALDGLPMPREATGLGGPSRIDRVVVSSPAMKAIIRRVVRLAAEEARVLIEGETGTGKEVIARALHDGSPRAKGPFVALNCAGLSPELAESRLFGYARGAFTGAVDHRPGAIEAANGGTLFLDEIGELHLGTQAILLRFLETGDLQRVGETVVRRPNVRVIAATNQLLEQDLAAGQFRRDLFYRLVSRGPCRIPPLRERPEDLTALVSQWCDGRGSGPDFEVTPEAVNRLKAYGWPGNMRELRAVLTEAAEDARPRRTIALHGIERALATLVAEPEPSSVVSPHDAEPPTGVWYSAASALSVAARGTLDRSTILDALHRHRWHTRRTAAGLGIGKSTLYRLMRKLKIKRKTDTEH